MKLFTLLIALLCPAAFGWPVVGFNTQPIPNLVGYWNFNINSPGGNAGYDSSGLNETLAATLSSSTNGIIMEGFYLFSGGSAIFGSATWPGLSGKNAATIAIWMQTTNLGRVVTKWGATGASQAFLVERITGGSMQFACSSGASILVAQTTQLVNTTNWVHFACTWATPSTVLFYTNGVLCNTTVTLAGTPATIQLASSSFRIGKESGGSVDTAIGSYDECRIYDRVLSADEIKLLYNGGAGRQKSF